MSLINKMLQDLDARGGAPQAAGIPAAVRAVPGARPYRHRALLLGLAAAIVLAGAAFAGWTYWKMAPGATVEPAPVQAKGVIRGAPAVEAPQATPPEQMVDGLPLPLTPDAGAVPPAKPEIAQAEAPKPQKARRPATMAQPGEPRPAQPAPSARGLATKADKAAIANGPVQVMPVARDAGAQPGAAALFERAQRHLLNARIEAAIADLEAALELDQRYLAARETLVAVLVENQRQAEAMRHLRRALALSPQQTGMAMLLARMQLEHGGGAIDTLERSLPYADANADYRAMLAGVLERAGRHREAADHYQGALRLQPANGIWWMGLAISLQAEKRHGEAKAAFLRARDSGSLSAELQTFVERRLQQLD